MGLLDFYSVKENGANSMIYIIAFVALVIGIIAGFKYAAYCNGKVFQALLDQGVMVVRSSDGWEGKPSAFLSIMTWFSANAESGAPDEKDFTANESNDESEQVYTMPKPKTRRINVKIRKIEPAKFYYVPDQDDESEQVSR
jgi:hypothetical protein